jgi:hypothetical protein
MNNLSTIYRNVSSVSIWKPPGQDVLSDTSENDKSRAPGIGLEGLRAINRIVSAIKNRIEPEPVPGK